MNRLLEHPDDRELLKAVVEYYINQEKFYYKLGELYLVPVPDVGMVTKELGAFGTRCQLQCLAFECPGLLVFRDGSTACPVKTRIAKAVATDPFTLPLQLVQRLLYRGKARGSVELFDGRTITFTIKSPKS